MNAPEIVVRCTGEIESVDLAYGRTKLADLVRDAPVPVGVARLDLSWSKNRSQERPARAKARLDLDGTMVRVDISTPTLREAVDLAIARLRRQVERTTEVRRSVARRRRDEAWHHGDAPSPRPSFADRPADDRDVVRRKTWASTPMDVDAATLEATLLDHDFFLYHDATVGEPRVVVREGDGRRTVTPLRITAAEARSLLDLGDTRFVFFVDAGGAQVLYRRYDGHYGVIEPA